MQLPEVNLDAISDLATREVVRQLLNIIEAQATEIAALQAENQQLRDELVRLKGGSGKPDIKPSLSPASNHSSEAERRTPTPRGKPKKNQTLTVTREQRCVVDPATLPPGARFNGTRETSPKTSSSRSRSSAFCARNGLFPQPIRPPLP